MNTHNPQNDIEAIVKEFDRLYVVHCSDGDILDGMVDAKNVKKWLRTLLTEQATQQAGELQKAREEERGRIEAVFKEHVPPHAMDLEDSVWLKRLLNKAFQHENLY